MGEGQAAVVAGETDYVAPMALGASVDAAFDTFPKLLKRHAATRGARPAMREKDWKSVV